MVDKISIENLPIYKKFVVNNYNKYLEIEHLNALNCEKFDSFVYLDVAIRLYEKSEKHSLKIHNNFNNKIKGILREIRIELVTNNPVFDEWYLDDFEYYLSFKKRFYERNALEKMSLKQETLTKENIQKTLENMIFLKIEKGVI